MLSTKYIIRCTKNPKGGGVQKHPLHGLPEINPACSDIGVKKVLL